MEIYNDIQLNLVSTLNSSFSLSIDKTDILDFTIDGVSASSVDYFDIEGRKCNITCDLTEELKQYIINNYYDYEIEQSADLGGQYYGFYTELLVDGMPKFYGLISKESIKASLISKEISFDIEDMLSVWINLDTTTNMDSYTDETFEAGAWIDILLEKVNVQELLLSNGINIKTIFDATEYSVNNNWEPIGSLTINGSISNYEYPQYELNTLLEYTRAKRFAKEQISPIFVSGIEYMHSEYRMIYVRGSVEWDIINNTYNAKVYGTYTQILEYFDGVVLNTNISAVNEETSTYVGADRLTHVAASADLYSMLDTIYTTYYTDYLDTFINNTSFTNTLGTYSLTLVEGGTEVGDNTIKYNGVIAVNELDLSITINPMGIVKPLMQLLFITNYTIYCEGRNVIISSKYPGFLDDANINVLQSEILDDLTYSRILYETLDYESKMTLWNINDALTTTIEAAYNTLLSNMLVKLNYTSDLVDYFPGQKINIEGDGDCILLSNTPDYLEQTSKIEVIKGSI